ncbi:MAG: hypothetical protein H6Q36_1329 [Chloroflexi bacterium]|nr:hypothetical protein [Chloroflexota bacterium]
MMDVLVFLAALAAIGVINAALGFWAAKGVGRRRLAIALVVSLFVGVVLIGPPVVAVCYYLGRQLNA